VKTCLFAGPTLYGEPIPAGIDGYGPAVMGSVYRAVEAGYQRIGIVDGLFGNVPSIWHKEILYAMTAGVDVAGAASMGALRAAELSAYGMVGIGRIYRLYRSGRWTDDDEVAVTHATEYLAFRPLSEVMSNIRFTLRRLRRLGVIERRVEAALVAGMKARHFSERTREELRRQIGDLAGAAAANRIAQRFAHEYVDVKDDARALLILAWTHDIIRALAVSGDTLLAQAVRARPGAGSAAVLPPMTLRK
jgi:hypothetical protein